MDTPQPRAGIKPSMCWKTSLAMKLLDSVWTRLVRMADLPRHSKEFGAGGRTRTDMSLTSPDFESGAYTNFATPAASIARKDNKSNDRRTATQPYCTTTVRNQASRYLKIASLFDNNRNRTTLSGVIT